jgi:hypothetical protein
MMWISDGLITDGYILMALKAILIDGLIAYDFLYNTAPPNRAGTSSTYSSLLASLRQQVESPISLSQPQYHPSTSPKSTLPLSVLIAVVATGY